MICVVSAKTSPANRGSAGAWRSGENAEYDAAKEDAVFNEMKIAEMQQKISRAGSLMKMRIPLNKAVLVRPESQGYDTVKSLRMLSFPNLRRPRTGQDLGVLSRG